MRNIVLVSHGDMAAGVKSSLEMIVGKQEHVSVVSLREDGDNIQFENDLKEKMKALNTPVLIIADLLGGTPCNVAFKNYAENEQVDIIAGLSLPLVIEATLNDSATIKDLLGTAKTGIADVKGKVVETETSKAEIDLEKYAEFKGKANVVNVRIDERLIHGQVAGIWSTSLNTQRIVVINDEASQDSLQKSSLRMAAPSTMRLSVLTVEEAAKNVESGKYGNQRIFLLFKNPTDVLRYVEAGGTLKTVNVGNMSHKEGSREVTKSIQVTKDEEVVFENLITKGIEITAQLVPNDPSINFIEKMRR
ncbi:PTS mannose/fructose/sorbose transporter subunit IIAB [Vagococcus silagei]|uniref:PTS system mannose-specific EIIAB component n=1 Tax=Vagococcus silagei TaxID=2508885 RepID=A0A4S3B2V6_9ENTE|nr:PTS mannose/fructose/sorbose transporter subunit IIAB [Vagococcus silagei]THB60748.1 PTS mannose/fructose/sorbose transporter subunit IIAB [Vagococcus silagei]